MNITKKYFVKTLEGGEIDVFTLSNSKGMEVKIMNYGGIVLSIMVPDNKGNFDDVALGFAKLEDYFENKPFFGAIIGRHANRIHGARFNLNGVEYSLYNNDGSNHLHGGKVGFNKVLWNAEIINNHGNQFLQLSYLSKDGEEGYPGNLNVKVTYAVTEDNELCIEYYAISDKDTVVNLTNHSYFNLAGHDSGDILNHKVMINADKFTVNDEFSIPTGEIEAVEGTPMNFKELRFVSDGINSEYNQVIFGSGYDHNWVLNTGGDVNSLAAKVVEEKTGRVLEVYTTKPGVQLYTGNFLEDSFIGKGGKPYHKRSGLCLETQYFPNSLENKNFPSAILKAGEEYKYATIYKFATNV